MQTERRVFRSAPWAYGVALAVVAFGLNSSQLNGQALPASVDEQNWGEFRDFIVPAAEELAWRNIAWESTLWDAVQRGQREDKPLLIWAMNGHPLGCT